MFGTVGERFRPQETAVGLGAFRTGSGPDLPQLTPRQRDQPRFGEAEHRFVGRRIDHLDVQRRGFGEAAFFLGDTLGRQGEHHQHRLVAVAHEDPSQRRAVRRHQVVAKLLDGGERPGCTFGRTFGRGSRRGVRPCAEYRLEPLHERGPARRQGDRREVAALIEHAHCCPFANVDRSSPGRYVVTYRP